MKFQETQLRIFEDGIQVVPKGKVNFLGGHRIGHSKQENEYEYMPYS
jgi:hypothetical protein